MKTSTHFSVNPLRSLFVFAVAIMVLCPGENYAFAQALTNPTQAKAQLHIPWTLLSERLKTLVNSHQADGSPASAPLGNRLISVPYDGSSIDWALTSGTISSSVSVKNALLQPSNANIAVTNGLVHIVLDSLVLDQVVEKNVGGVVVRLHLNAVCGPIMMDQSNAEATGIFGINWMNGSPVASLTGLDLSWAPNSWTFNAFTCTGAQGVDSLVRDGLMQFLREPASLKPYVQAYISQNLQAGVDATLARLRAPFAVGSGAGAITVTVGSLAPASTGVVADLTLQTDAKSAPLPALPVPAVSLLSTLSKTQPVLVGDKSVIELLVASRLAAQGKYLQVNLQNVKAFHDLMHSRFKQFFAWGELLNFPEDYPFYLNVLNPGHLSLAHASGSTLTSSISFSSIIQAYRDSTWWNFVTTKGVAQASVTLSVKAGSLTYTTTINSLAIKSAYGANYAAKYGKKGATLPDSIVENSIVGPQAGLSGTLAWPNVDLDQAGQYQAASLTWPTKDTFSLGFAPLN